MNAIITRHATFLLPPVLPPCHDQPARYCAEVTSNPRTLEAATYQRPCSRHPAEAEGPCPTCGVAWARHGRQR